MWYTRHISKQGQAVTADPSRVSPHTFSVLGKETGTKWQVIYIGYWILDIRYYIITSSFYILQESNSNIENLILRAFIMALSVEAKRVCCFIISCSDSLDLLDFYS